MAEEVKIVVAAETRQAVSEINKVTDASKRAIEATQKTAKQPAQMVNPAAQRRWEKIQKDYADKPKSDTKADTTQRNRALLADAELNLAQARASGAAPTVIAQRERQLRERRLANRFMREQGMDEKDAMGMAGDLVGAQSAAKDRASAAKVEAKTRVDAERKATQEMQEQERISKRMTMRIGGTAVSAGFAGLEQILNYQSEMQGVGLRDTAGRAINQRQIGIMSSWRGSSTDTQAKQFAAEDRIFDRQQNRPNLQNTVRSDTRDSTLTGAAAGAAIGSMVPVVGTLLGAILGGATGYARGRMNGNVILAEDKTAQERDEKERDAAKKLKHEQFTNEEGGLELDAIRARSQRTLSGIRQAQTNDLIRSGMTKFRAIKAQGGSDSEAKEGAMLDTQNQLRDKQLSAASGLVDARAGASDIAAAARWGQIVTPTMDAVKQALDYHLPRLYTQGEKAIESYNLEPFGK